MFFFSYIILVICSDSLALSASVPLFLSSKKTPWGSIFVTKNLKNFVIFIDVRSRDQRSSHRGSVCIADDKLPTGFPSERPSKLGARQGMTQTQGDMQTHWHMKIQRKLDIFWKNDFHYFQLKNLSQWNSSLTSPFEAITSCQQIFNLI